MWSPNIENLKVLLPEFHLEISVFDLVAMRFTANNFLSLTLWFSNIINFWWRIPLFSGHYDFIYKNQNYIERNCLYTQLISKIMRAKKIYVCYNQAWTEKYIHNSESFSVAHYNVASSAQGRSCTKISHLPDQPHYILADVCHLALLFTILALSMERIQRMVWKQLYFLFQCTWL